ncbi:U3 small nucleolar RNA-associated protein 14 homolog A isoform X1 [Sarcophilus harrisii]|uniref:U3 small nucleolar RNA-associated protein 14 homolog A isoform X1 n=1 Tax=Sarcophilus harrisii TaxID=9305 RepID=UPI00062BF12A|nr:U3 small nucleolar RNA-associated protein 14 homolog A isoform X1 [Sarcophilus harrisii]
MKVSEKSRLRVVNHEDEVLGLLTDCELSTRKDEGNKNCNKYNGEIGREMDGEIDGEVNGEVDGEMDGEMDGVDDEGDHNNDERKHQKLLNVICGLGGRKRLKLAERSEASLQVSEFSVSTEGTGEKLELSELLAPIKVSSSLGSVKKRLKNVKNKKTVELPLSKEENERVLREAAYNKISQDMDKWEPIVMKNRGAAQLVFPLEQERVLDVPIEEVIEGWKVSTPLEKEIFSLLHKNKQPVTNTVLTPEEKASLKAMSLEEAKQRRAELQKARALQSYYEARARREKKVKSKRFHKMLKKKKNKEVLKQFEELRKINPTAALEQLQKIENARIQERMTLKHQNSGKWAKSKAIMAKYDLEARKAMQEQLTKNKELTQKLEVPSESEHDEDEEEDAGLIPAIVNEVQLSIDGPNPWMQKQRLNHVKNSPTQKKPVANEAAESEEEEEATAEDELLLREVEERRAFWKSSKVEQGLQNHTMTTMTVPEKTKEDEELLVHLRDLSKQLKQKAKKIRQNGEQPESPPSATRSKPSVQREERALLNERPARMVEEDLEALDAEEVGQEPELRKPVLERHSNQKNPQKTNEPVTDLHTIISVKPHIANSFLSIPTIVEQEDCDEDIIQKQLIKEAFAGDDVIADFQREKREAEKASEPKDIDLCLPGWGQWGGAGLAISARKRRRFLIKAPKASPRKDKSLPNVVITEKRNVHAAAHQVNVLPFPFTHPNEFEHTIKTPVGTTWNTQRAFQKLTAPQVVTKPGHIIEPIKESNVESSPSHSNLPNLQKKGHQYLNHLKREPVKDA